jgi:hypothetical protein
VGADGGAVRLVPILTHMVASIRRYEPLARATYGYLDSGHPRLRVSPDVQVRSVGEHSATGGRSVHGGRYGDADDPDERGPQETCKRADDESLCGPAGYLASTAA